MLTLSECRLCNAFCPNPCPFLYHVTVAHPCARVSCWMVFTDAESICSVPCENGGLFGNKKVVRKKNSKKKRTEGKHAIMQ
jgi:hypothetical protein